MQGIQYVSGVVRNKKCQPVLIVNIYYFLDVQYLMSHENNQALLRGCLPTLKQSPL